MCNNCVEDAVAGDAIRALGGDPLKVAAQIPAMVENEKGVARLGCRCCEEFGSVKTCDGNPICTGKCTTGIARAILASAGIEWREAK